MRALVLKHSANPGGSLSVLLAVLRHAPADAALSTVFFEDGPGVAEARALRRGPVAFVDAGRARELWRVPGVVRRVRALAREHEADVIFSHVSKAQAYGALAARLEGLPSVWWQHEHPRQARPIQEVVGRLPADAVICSSAWVAAEQRRRHPRTPAYAIPPAAVELPAAPPRVHLAGAGDAPVIGVVGRLTRWKRVELVLEAFAQIHAAVPGAQLRIVGGTTPGIDADYAAELRARTAALGLDRAVTFTGHLPDAAAEMARLDLLLHAASEEPFGLIFVEALGHGVPVVAVDEGGAPEVVRDGLDGLVVGAPYVPRLAAAAIALLSDPDRRTRMGAAGRRRVEDHFTPGRMAAQAWDLVAQVTSARTAAAKRATPASAV